MPFTKTSSILACSLLALATACGDNDPDTNTTDQEARVRGDAIKTYASIVHASYVDSAAAAGELDDAIQAFVADPTEDTLEVAREAWLDAREPYLQTEVYRFYDGPIDNPTDGPEGLINAWPLDEAYIDYVADDETAGIVNDPSVDITEEELESLNEQGGEQNIATGFHAVEFLLWGQDSDVDGPGNRPAADYVTDGSGSAANQERRAQYLTTASAMLKAHLDGLVAAWAPEADYRVELESVDTDEALTRILTGMIVLSGFETGGERLQTALDSGDQEDEHSCFSDNTHRDMVQDVQGVLNVYQGSYTRTNGTAVSGTGIRDVVRLVSAELAEQLDERIADSLDLAEALEPPFDQEIALDNEPGRERVTALIEALHAQEDSLEDAFRALDLDIPVTE
jgi:putative iron-regulated protein